MSRALQTTTLESPLNDLIDAENLKRVQDQSAKENFRRDETPGLYGEIPLEVVSVQSAHDVEKLVQICMKTKVPLIARGAGSGKAGGAIIETGTKGVICDFRTMNRILRIDRENQLVFVEPGVVLKDLQDAVEAEGLFYPPDPASLSWCTLGGNVATNAGGARAVKYGVTRDYVNALEFVDGRSQKHRVGRPCAKSVVGYNIKDCLVGSEGTLGLLTQMTLRLLPKPRHVGSAVFVFKTRKDAASFISQMSSLSYVPRCAEYLDRESIDSARKLGVPYRFAEDAEAAILFEVDGFHDDALYQELELALKLAEACGSTMHEIALDERARQRIWDSRRALSEATRKRSNYKISEDIVVPRSRIIEMVQTIRERGQGAGLDAFAFGHAGDGNLHVQVCFDDDALRERVLDFHVEIFKEALRMGGSISGEHGIGLAKRESIGLEIDSVTLELHRKIKSAFDPDNILNPGKIFSECA